MPGLTVTEKQRWKDRIAKKIDKKIDAIYSEDANLNERIQREARNRALASLNLKDLDAEVNEIEDQENQLEKRKDTLNKQMLAKVRCGGS